VYTHLMTIPQAKITERESLPPVMLFTTVGRVQTELAKGRSIPKETAG
jgi:hypothetical protein